MIGDRHGGAGSHIGKMAAQAVTQFLDSDVYSDSRWLDYLARF
jgi:hypothetical protein